MTGDVGAGTDPRLLPLWRVVHERLSSGRPVTTVRIGPWSEAEREAVADLLGLDRIPSPGAGIALGTLERALDRDDRERGSGHRREPALRTVVERALGPIGDRRADRTAARGERAALWSWLAGHPAVRAEPALQDWVTQVRRAGLLGGSVAATRELLDQALAVLAALPADGVGLPVFADRMLHDPHALDEGRRLTGLVLQALACLTGVAAGEGTESRRGLWQRWGVETDALSSTVLVAGLRPTAGGHVGALLSACADAGEAAVLTLAQVRTFAAAPVDPPAAGGVPGTGGPPLVHVVENPSVMAAALVRFGATCPPLVCTSGWPSAAGVLLLRTLRSRRAVVRYHGDLDGDGLRIAAHLVSRAGAVPWRMTCEDYERALARRRVGPPAGRVSDVPWDGGLGPALRAAGTAVTEEAVLDELLGDLAALPAGDLVAAPTDDDRNRRPD